MEMMTGEAFGGGDELLLHIFSFLSCRDVCRIAPTSRRFARVANDESLWRSFCFRCLPRGECSLTSTRTPSSSPSSSSSSSLSLSPRPSVLAVLFRSFTSSQLEATPGPKTWRQLFRERFWLGPRVRGLVRQGGYAQQKEHVLSAFLEELMRPPYLLAAAVAHSTPAGSGHHMAGWMLDLALSLGGLPLGGTSPAASSSSLVTAFLIECFVMSMISAHLAIGAKERQSKKSEAAVATSGSATATAASGGVGEDRLMSTATCSKLITRFFHLVGDTYLRELLADVLIAIGKRLRKRIKKSKKGHNDVSLLRMNRDAVAEIAQDAYAIIERIVQNVDKMPLPIRRVCQHIHAEANQSGQGWHLVQLCLFYRFIFPSIVDSSQYDVFSEEVKYYGMKAYMIGVTKVLQSLCQPQEEDLSTSDTTDQGATTDDAKAGHQAQPPNESNIAKLMGGFQRQLLDKEGVNTEESPGEDFPRDDVLMTRQGATKALHALESLSAQIERKRPQPAPIADWSSLEYEDRVRRLLQDVYDLYDPSRTAPHKAPHSGDSTQRCLLC